MSDNFLYVYASGAQVVLKSTEDDSVDPTVHTPHINVDTSVLPTGAATSANQTNKSQMTQITDGTDEVAVEELSDDDHNLDGLKALLSAAVLFGRIDADTIKPIRIDGSTHSIQTIDYGHHEIHAGSAYSAFEVDSDFDASDEINICFVTPNTTKYLHMLVSAVCSSYAELKLCEKTTITASTGTNKLARNRNRNQSDESVIVSTFDGSAYSYTSNATITNEGTILHSEMLGGGSKQGGAASGGRNVNEFILKANTTYAFKLIGIGVSANNGVASLEVTWYEHIDKD